MDTDEKENEIENCYKKIYGRLKDIAFYLIDNKSIDYSTAEELLNIFILYLNYDPDNVITKKLSSMYRIYDYTSTSTCTCNHGITLSDTLKLFDDFFDVVAIMTNRIVTIEILKVMDSILYFVKANTTIEKNIIDLLHTKILLNLKSVILNDKNMDIVELPKSNRLK